MTFNKWMLSQGVRRWSLLQKPFPKQGVHLLLMGEEDPVAAIYRLHVREEGGRRTLVVRLCRNLVLAGVPRVAAKSLSALI